MSITQEEVATLVKTEYQNLTTSDLLQKPTSALFGVSVAAADALLLLETRTIFDLATSDVFMAASKILEAGTDAKSAIYRHGSATTDLVRQSAITGTKIDQLRFLKIDALDRVPNDKAATIAKALDVENIRDLALYPPYKAATRMLNAVYFPENVPGFDPEQPADLLPKNGEYPTERVQYTTLVMDEIKVNNIANQIDIMSDQFKPLDLAKLALGDSGFQNVAYGALITIGQSWFAQGVTLGHLLHSVSLAPGESTRLAVVDWTRKSKAGQTEVIQDEDELSNDSSHNRAMNEVTGATANDAQSGFSQSNQHSNSQSASVAASASASYFGMASISISGQYSTASTDASADSYSTSSGHRDLASDMVQNVNDRTHQNAHSIRSKRASIVKEVSQSEHEAISTRVLANYNHMHALTMQYYEVVQIYRTKVSVSKVDKVVFIPVKLLDFEDDALIRRFKGVLRAASPTASIQDAIQNLDVIELAPARDTRFTWLGGMSIPTFKINPGVFTLRPELEMAAVNPSISGPSSGTAAAPIPPAVSPRPPATSVLPNTFLNKFTISDKLWNTTSQSSRLAGILSRPLFRENSDSIFLPTDAAIEGALVEAETATITVSFKLLSGAVRDSVDSEHPIPLTDISGISVKGSSNDREVTARVQLTLSRNGVRFPMDLPAVTIAKANASLVPIVTVTTGGINTNVKKFLAENKLYYSTAVFRSLDTTQLALLLSGYVIKMKEKEPATTAGAADQVVEKLVPVSQVVEPRPIRYVGNYLAFKMNSNLDDPDWQVWLKRRGLDVGAGSEDVVPLPSGGTFAEAVLGRYNCAEKLDITRFWNWQDSPTPLLPSDIAAIQTGKHDTSDGLNPGQLSNPIINMAAPSSLPDPSGTAAVLSAIQNGNMFRDQSGLQGTQALAQAGTQAAAAAATSAGQQASMNLANQLQADTERQRIQAQKDVSVLQATGGSSSSKGGLNHSQDGAKINYFDTMKAKSGQTSKGTPSGTSSGTLTSPGTNSSSTGTNNGFATGSSSDTGSSSGVESFTQNPAALAATWGGDGQSRSSLIDQAVNSSGPALQNVGYTTEFKNAKESAGWMDLITYTTPPAIVADLAKREISVQKIEDALGNQMNLDFFPVRIDKFPTINGKVLDGAAFLSHIRKNLDDFVDTDYSTFEPFKADLDKAKWESDNPLGAVVKIDVAGPDNAAVCVAETDDAHWRFVTLRTPFRDTGSHPVSGTREFGLKDGRIFYTRGADRPTEILESLFTPITFGAGAKLWKSLQAKTAAFVNHPDHGGEAIVLEPVQKQLSWDGYVMPSFGEMMLQSAQLQGMTL